MSFETIRLERPKDGIAVLTLNRPEKKNAMNIRMFEELRVAFQSVSSSTKDRALIVTGAGDAFCSGADLSMEGSDGRSTLDVMRGIHGGPLALSVMIGGTGTHGISFSLEGRVIAREYAAPE